MSTSATLGGPGSGGPSGAPARAGVQPDASVRTRLARRGFDGVTLLVLPAAIFVLALFIYPFLYGLVLSFEPKDGHWLDNYRHFFSDPECHTSTRRTCRTCLRFRFAVSNRASHLP